MLILNYLFLNRWLIQNKSIIVSNYANWLLENTPFWIFLFVINLICFVLILFKKVEINNSPFYFALAFFIFQFSNIYSIENSYFWTSVPDSRTYELLGLNLLNCGTLSLDCGGTPFLQWPIGQPIISGILSKYFYSTAKYIYLTIFALSIYLIGKITNNMLGNFSIVGLSYFLILPNNYELSSLIISEIPYIFFTVYGLYLLKNNQIKFSSIIFMISFLIRPIGVINIFVFILYIWFKLDKKISYYIVILLLFFVSIMSFNLILHDEFTISNTISANLQNDEYDENNSLINYSTNFFSQTNREFLLQNIKRLYGEGSRDCFFDNCFIYNPLFNKDGTLPQLLNANSIFGKVSNPVLSFIYKIASPINIWTYIPLAYFLCLFGKNKFVNLITSLFFLNILLSILTSEYGSRWWLLPNMLSIYLLSYVFCYFYKLKSYV